MKYLNSYFLRLALLVSIGLGGFTSTTAFARVGESAQAIERRIFSNGGVKYRDDEIIEKRSNGMPYVKYMQYMPGGVNVAVYFKTHDGRKPKSSDLEANRMQAGWDLHIVYVNGKSVLEVYKRSQGMSEFEFNQLLVLQGGSGWQKVEKASTEGEEKPSAFGYTMETRDSRVRAVRLGGDSVMFVTAEIDQGLAIAETRDLQNLAPLSIQGF